MFRKIMKFTCLIIMLSLLFLPINARAVYDGSSATYLFRTNPVKNVKSGSVKVSYDTTALKITKAYWEFPTTIENFNKETNEGVFTLSEPWTISGLIFGITFKVKLTAEEKRYDIKIDIKLIDVDDNETHISETRWYDVKCSHYFDGKVVDDKYLVHKGSCLDAARYYISCVYCGKAGTDTFTTGEILPHQFDEKIENDLYISKPGTCTTKTEYFYACRTCGKKGTTTYEGSETPMHLEGDEWYADENKHWHECFCGEKIQVKPHTYYHDCDKDCNECGYERKVTHIYRRLSNDDENHWYECSCGKKVEVKAHTYDSDCDKDCNGCGYERTITHTFGSWVSDDVNHWKECSCGEKSEVAAHTPGAEATETTPQTCTVCNHVLKEAAGHTHNYGSEWKKDSENHWHECVCGDKKDVSAHKFDNGVVKEEATEDKEGLKVYSCVCGYEKTETLPKLEPAKKGCKKDLAALVVGVISLSMVGVLLKRKEK